MNTYDKIEIAIRRAVNHVASSTRSDVCKVCIDPQLMTRQYMEHSIKCCGHAIFHSEMRCYHCRANIHLDYSDCGHIYAMEQSWSN